MISHPDERGQDVLVPQKEGVAPYICTYTNNIHINTKMDTRMNAYKTIRNNNNSHPDEGRENVLFPQKEGVAPYICIHTLYISTQKWTHE